MILSRKQLVIRYAAFACIATLANLGAQRFVLIADGGWYVPALLTGTGVGLLVKYVLDKRWIFYDASGALPEETRKFSRYVVTGVGTTLIFWGSETVFWTLGETQALREIGAVLGLSVGYVVKYNLDYRFVFRPKRGISTDSSGGEHQEQDTD